MIGVTFALLVGLTRPQLEPASHTAVRALLMAQQNAWNKGDLAGFMAGYWQSPQLTFYSGKDKRAGWQETFDRYKARYQATGKEMGALTFSELIFEDLAPGVVLARGRWKLQLKEKSPEGLFSLIVKKLPEGWRVVHDHTSGGD